MGSKTGWIIAAVMVLFVGGLIVKFVVFPSPTPPTSDTLRKGVMEFKAPKTSVEVVAGVKPSGPGNAADTYVQAIKYIEDKRNAWDAIETHLAESDAPLSAARQAHCEKLMELIRPAANAEGFRYTFEYTPKEFIISPRAQGTEDLWRLGWPLKWIYEHYQRAGEHDKAIEAAQRLCLLGWHVASERVRAEMTLTGFDMQDIAMSLLEQAYTAADNPGAAETCRNYGYEVSAAKTDTVEKFRKLAQTIQPNPGDIFNIIENDEDRTWRVEGVLQLGRLKFSAPGRGDQRYVDKYIEEYLNSDDPYLKAAAEVAKSVTMEQLQNWVDQ